MRRYQCLSTLRSTTHWTPYSCVKYTAIVCVTVAILHIMSLKFNENVVEREEKSSEARALFNWHCELNKRMIVEMQKQLKEKDKLLNYRAKVIFSLRSQLAELNKTNTSLKKTLANITNVLTYKRINATKNATLPVNQNQKYTDSIVDNVNKQARPCCIALKRMTDILRVYMETTDDLRDQLDAYEKFNFTERMNEIAEQEKLNYESLNCSERFLHDAKNVTKKQERLSVYQSYSNGYFYETFPVNRIEPKQKAKHKSFHRNTDFTRAVNEGLKTIIEKTNLEKKYFALGDALLKYDELTGAEYKFTFYYNISRSFQISLVKPYAKFLLSERIVENLEFHKELINIIVPISGLVDRFFIFLQNLKTIISQDKAIFLTVVIYGSDPQNRIKNSVKQFSRENRFHNYDILKKNVPFNRGHALHDGILRWNGYPNVLLFLCDIDVTFDLSFLNRCRKYSEFGKSVYMPILFSLYNPAIVFGKNGQYTRDMMYNITTSTGTWRPLGYGMLCAYKPDYLRVNGFNLKIKGWGGEDVSLYQRFLKKNVKVIRAPDPGLFHAWHEKICDPLLSKRQYEFCLGSKARYEGSQRQLGILLFSRRRL